MERKIYLAGGCFWGVEHFFKKAFNDSIKTKVGYLNSSIKNPSYELVCNNETNAVEAVEIIYDDSKISVEQLIEALFLIIDPTSLNKQGNDEGKQYRTGIYSNYLNDLNTAKKMIKELQTGYHKKIAVEVEPIMNFYDAETYHQDYLNKNPDGYCHIDMKLISKVNAKSKA